jgi:hypothetical protein
LKIASNDFGVMLNVVLSPVQIGELSSQDTAQVSLPLYDFPDSLDLVGASSYPERIESCVKNHVK